MKKGFTLLELLVVIAIIGVLAAVIMASLANSRVRGTDAKMQTQIKESLNMVDLYDGNKDVFSLNECDVAPDTIFAESGLGQLFDGVILDNSRCYSSDGGGSWVIAIELQSQDGAFCVDYLGSSGSNDSNGDPYSSAVDAVAVDHCR
ncbi:MAG: type II secretion system protein [Patescibacteria group bacterium]|nr:type II secretion system protein [Patescibacteria group bacterium]